MPEFRYGPVEMYVVGFAQEKPDPGAWDALTNVLATGAVRLLDLVVISKDSMGEVAILELEGNHLLDLDIEPDPLADGLIAEEDLVELAAPMPRESSAVVLALELAFERTLAERLAQGGGEVLQTTRVPAPVVNAIIDLYEAVEGK
ncbi:DUF6325 family protein [Citricoccus sp.]|uniref:DUF6325 family protein n=1 Tax=Citricoccus sp. TaxID=1978372 RepID=UPI0028BF3244|nr:DUF6325 family protein [Citricoccus sp.]